MRTTVTLDDALIAEAREVVGIEDTSALLREGLESLVEREATRRTVLLSGDLGVAAPFED